MTQLIMTGSLSGIRVTGSTREMFRYGFNAGGDSADQPLWYLRQRFNIEMFRRVFNTGTTSRPGSVGVKCTVHGYAWFMHSSSIACVPVE